MRDRRAHAIFVGGLEGGLVGVIALAARLAMVAWAASRIPPAADGTFYQRIAERIAAGLGYTWLWPDGVVTYAAHYPVGYPGLIGVAYAIAGPAPVVAMIVNAVIGAVAAVAAYDLASASISRAAAGEASTSRLPLVAGMLVALHPGLVAYTPALMTEGVTAALLVLAAAVTARVREGEARGSRVFGASAIGLVIGMATLVRPQMLVFAPFFAALTRPRWAVAARNAAIASLVALLTVAPWTARNCVRMNRCALVSVNGGWNLLIGADDASTGAWSPVQVPDACREVFDEAGKDTCFGRAAVGFIEAHPAAWIALAPKKLAATFDYAGAAPWYLHEANQDAFPRSAKEVLGGVETIFERAMLLLALAALGRRTKHGAPRAIALVGAVFLFTRHAWVSYLAASLAILVEPLRLRARPVLESASGIAILATAATHAVFFGSGRYSLVLFPLVTALAPFAWSRDLKGEAVEPLILGRAVSRRSASDAP